MEVASFFSGSIPLSQQNHQHSTSSQLNFPPLSPQIFLIGQKTHCEEIISKNGIQKTVHTVVKNSPFHFTLGITGSGDFNRIAFDAFLVYDEGNKEVDYVKVKPIDFKANPLEDGSQLECEARIKVLTSHHEDLLFKLRIQGFSPSTKEEISGTMIYTFPIKVISKPEQLKKRPPSKKRTLTDMLVETITRIEKKQEEQQALIERVLNQQLVSSVSNPPPAPAVVDQSSKKFKHDMFWEALTDNDSKNSKENSKEKEKDKDALDFEHAFVGMLKSYTGMTQEEKPETIRKIIRNSSSRETERLSELLDLFWTEGLLKERSFGRNVNANSNVIVSGNSMENEGCSCSDCPHKVELERIDDFYKEFLQTGISLPGF